MSRTKRGLGISIRWKLAAFLAVFIAIVLIVTWVFQVYLLNTFHEYIKKNELQESAGELAKYVQSEELSMRAYSYALNGTMSVGVYHILEERAVTLVNVDATGQSGMPLGDRMLSKFYHLAQENGGRYLGQFTFGGYEVNKENGFFPFENDAQATDNISPKNIRLIYVQVEKGSTDDSYMIILDTSLQPLDSTVQILRTQFFWIAVILLICAGIMVFLLYRHISAPLVRMNESAKQLARGKYDTVFSGDGYLETRELASTLNYASYELSRLDALQKELIANISHDLRTPLTMIKGYGEIMRDLPGENTPENMQIVIDETTRLSELVNDLLDLSRIQTGTRKPKNEHFDLTAALEEIMLRYDTFVRHKGYHIHVEIDRHTWVCADRSMILQVLYNLINNAINYTGEDQSITVRQTVHENLVRISVIDTGDGIEEDQLPLIWDRYYKVDKVHRRAVIGTGLGLSIVKEILVLHNAAYGVESTLGKGSTFWFELPTVLKAEPLSDKTDLEV